MELSIDRRVALLAIPLAFAGLVVSAGEVTFSEHIAPIVYTKCAGCHRPGEAAPFSLTSYTDVAKRARLIAAVTHQRTMPPWPPEQASYPYRDSRRLSDAEIDLLRQWAAHGAPQGNPASAPALPAFPKGWQLGRPDLVVELPNAITVPAEGPDIYLSAVLPIALPEDKWIAAIELRPSARSVVHHVIFFAGPSGQVRAAAASGDRRAMRFGRGTVPLGGWAVGSQPHRLPDGLALSLPKGSDLVLQYHLHPTGKPESEKSTVGIYFAKQPPSRTLATLQLPPVFGLFSGVNIPAGEPNFSVKDSFTLPVDVDLVSVGAHAHHLGKAMTLTATLPSGEMKNLLTIRDWNFSWQDRYFFQDLVSLPAGTRLDAQVTWDNSAANPRNPANPPVAVRWGEQSTDEMGSVGLQMVAHRESDAETLQSEIRSHVRSTAVSRLVREPSLLLFIRERMGGEMPLGAFGGASASRKRKTAEQEER